MVNLSTVPDVMVREIIADRAKASYWLKKHFGGEKGYEKMRDKRVCQMMHPLILSLYSFHAAKFV